MFLLAQQFGGFHGRNAIFLGPCLCHFWVKVSAVNNFNPLNRGESLK